VVAAYTSSHVSPDQRFTRHHPCPICQGGDGDKRGRGIRCWGYLSDDGRYAYCTNDDYASSLPQRSNGTHKHKLDGPCNCGEDHSTGYRIDPPHRRPAPGEPASPPKRSHLKRSPIATHDYYDADGAIRFRVVRFWSGENRPVDCNLPKCMPQRPDGTGGWIDGLSGMTYGGLYRLPELLAADPWAPVFVPEGEKCADVLAIHGQVVTCNAGGAGKWHNSPGAREALRGRHVVILADIDEPGRVHAAQIVADVVGVAASVRVLELEGAHDVADWIAEGHTVDELRRLAAISPAIITYPSFAPESGQAQETRRAPQDDPIPETERTTCPNCHHWRDRARIAETTVANMRRDKWREDRILALDNAKVSAPVKLATLALGRELSDRMHQERNERGMPRIYRGSIAQRTGVKEKAAGAHMQKAEKVGFFVREIKPGFDDTAIYVAPTPLYENPDPDAVPMPDRANSWGGKRVKRCPECDSENLEIRVTCRDCGAVLTVDNVNKPEHKETRHASQDDSTLTGQGSSASETPQERQQQEPPPLDTRVGDLAADVEDDLPRHAPHSPLQPTVNVAPPARPCIRCRVTAWRWNGAQWECGCCIPGSPGADTTQAFVARMEAGL
jgi:hypothetical protein